MSVAEPAAMTARELLVLVAGESHALHTVIAKSLWPQQTWVRFTCSCGMSFMAPATKTSLTALRNVLEVKL